MQTVADARAAERGGADRLEIVRDLERDGLTPPPELVLAIAAECSLPLRVMLRESDGFSVADARELETLRRSLRAFASIPVDGVVVGYTQNGRLDLETMGAVLAEAPALRATCHRAFDASTDPLADIDRVKTLTQVDRLLTSGGAGEWAARYKRLEQYVARAGTQLTILAGGGIDESALGDLASASSVREAHVGRAAREPQEPGAPVNEERVRWLKTIAAGWAGHL